MNEYTAFVSTILTIIGTALAILGFTRSFLRDEISHVRDEISHVSDAIKGDIKHVSDIADQRHEDQRATHARMDARMEAQAIEFHDEQRATHARLDQLYQMFIELLKEGRK